MDSTQCPPQLLARPDTEIRRIATFLEDTFMRYKKSHAVIAVSGGIDSALSLTLLTHALSSHAISPVLLPYGEQNMDDARMICSWNDIPQHQWIIHNIRPIVDTIGIIRNIPKEDRVRQGNCMARARMILVYDIAKEHDALVCGTENRSEKELGYFTRFGDEASDIEPLQHLWKTQVRQLASHLGIPKSIREKNPTADLWEEQTDEGELGFSYDNADAILSAFLEKQENTEKLQAHFPVSLVHAVLKRRQCQYFKHCTPYCLTPPLPADTPEDHQQSRQGVDSRSMRTSALEGPK